MYNKLLKAYFKSNKPIKVNSFFLIKIKVNSFKSELLVNKISWYCHNMEFHLEEIIEVRTTLIGHPFNNKKLIQAKNKEIKQKLIYWNLE